MGPLNTDLYPSNAFTFQKNVRLAEKTRLLPLRFVEALWGAAVNSVVVVDRVVVSVFLTKQMKEMKVTGFDPVVIITLVIRLLKTKKQNSFCSHLKAEDERQTPAPPRHLSLYTLKIYTVLCIYDHKSLIAKSDNKNIVLSAASFPHWYHWTPTPLWVCTVRRCPRCRLMWPDLCSCLQSLVAMETWQKKDNRGTNIKVVGSTQSNYNNDFHETELHCYKM